MPADYIFEDIIDERRRQDAKWGGPEHDDTHNMTDWWRSMTHQFLYFLYWDAEGKIEAREMLVRIAALAVAGIESLDRKNGQE